MDWAGTPAVTKVGEKIPAICLDYGFGPDQEKVNLAERCAVRTRRCSCCVRVPRAARNSRHGGPCQLLTARMFRLQGKKVILLGLPGAFTPC